MNLEALLKLKAAERAKRHSVNETIPLFRCSEQHKTAAEMVDAFIRRLRGVA
ncbi:MAG: hypothetical protein WKG03_00265 [Telluria sp.]